MRFEILKRDGFRCRYCGATGAKTQLHVDHIEPRSLGGSDEPSNLITACRECNLGKRARRLDDEQCPMTHKYRVLDRAMRIACDRLFMDEEYDSGREGGENELLEFYFPDGLPRGFM